ncbi:MAG: DUF3616 domain-containing protein [bacterium]|nr:DUF3616 domain-containing protein [bacterium]
MRTQAFAALALALLALSAGGCNASNSDPGPPTLSHRGTCDASAGIAIGADRVLMASDEDNTLRVYRVDRDGPALQEIDWTTHLALADSKEVDIEGAATIGDVTYWIGSHGRDRRGGVEPSRQRLFATRVESVEDEVRLQPVGRAYAKLLDDLLASPTHANLGLREAIAPGRRRDADLSPKEGGLNVEGLAVARDGKGLLLGLRNPQVEGKAIVLQLANPRATIEGKERARLEEPALLALDGAGIRSLARLPGDAGYAIVAGPGRSSDRLALYRWPGPGDEQPTLLHRLDPGLDVEALIPFENPTRYLLLSDDGNREIDGVRCKTLGDPTRQSFRSTWVEID